MNYLAEIRAFYGWLGANPLKSPAISLWHALMSIANDASHGADWQKQITPSISMLQSRSGLGKDAILTARNQLKQAGLIDWRSRGGSSAAVYTIIPFVAEIPSQAPPQPLAQAPAQSTAQATPLSPAQVPSIYKQNKTQPDQTEKEQGKASPTRHKRGTYGWVKLSDAEYTALLEEFGEQTVQHAITYVDESAELTGNKNRWKNWNLTVRKAIREQWGKSGSPAKKPSSTSNGVLGSSSYDIAELERMIGFGVI